MSILGTLVRDIKALPIMRAARRERYRRHFLSKRGFARHYGVYRDFAEAANGAAKSAGFDQSSLASDYDDRLDRVFPYDYPFLFWLGRIFSDEPPSTIVDVGGSVGVHYYAYQKYLRYPVPLAWAVVEVEAIAEAGRIRAEHAKASGLRFTTSLAASLQEVHDTDIVLSAGALHYIEKPLLWEAIAQQPTKPRHILLNKLPLYDGEDFVSLQNIGQGFAPHCVWNRAKFNQRFERIGYMLVDAWSVPERSFRIFDDPVRSFGHYSGLYLRRR